MSSTSFRKSKRSGFSLLELLICIVIIVILGSALNPVLTGAKEQANMNKCTSNIRQISIALTSYAANNEDILPKVDQETTWMKAIEGEVKKSKEIFKCPSEPKAIRRDNKLELNDPNCSSYGLNLQVAGNTTDSNTPGVILSNIEQPSQTIILVELANDNTNCYCNPKIDNIGQLDNQVDFKRHGGKKQSIYLFVDGHTKAHSKTQLFDGTASSYDTSWFNPDRQ